jgi:predicted TPR repeat methyltransferase
MISVETTYPLAGWSADHVHPKGTMTDSTVRHGFNERIYNLVSADRLRILDLGCAGAGMVKSFYDDGAFAVGIDGSDYSKNRDRAEWATIPDNLFTADITKPFTVNIDGDQAVFDLITAWEVLEHIPDEHVEVLMNNIQRHLAPDGMFICSISQCEDDWEGFSYHVNVHDRDWWISRLEDLGWVIRDELFRKIDPEWVRGPENGMNSFPLVVTCERFM